MADLIWLSAELMEAIHDRQISEHGGAAGMRDRNLLESALARARQLHAYGGAEEDMPALAASYAYGIARDQPFIDGKKRTAAVACELFLELNGWKLVAEDIELYPVFISLASGELEEPELTAWLREHARPGQISEPAGSYS